MKKNCTNFPSDHQISDCLKIMSFKPGKHETSATGKIMNS